MRYFELINDKSSKFWQIHDFWNEDKKFVEVKFGKIGYNGRTVKHYYDGPAKGGFGTQMEQKLVAEKLKKGYVEKSKPTVLKLNKSKKSKTNKKSKNNKKSKSNKKSKNNKKE
jgi:predicted DNA-binding WGR domain protein